MKYYKSKLVKYFLYFLIITILNTVLIIFEERFIGSSGRNSLRLSFSPKNWQEIYNGLFNTLIISVLISISIIIYIYYYQKKMKEENIPEGPSLKDLLRIFLGKKDEKKTH